MNKRKIILIFSVLTLAAQVPAAPEIMDFFYAKKLYSVSVHSADMFMIWTAPLFPDTPYSAYVNDYYSSFCHQLPDRSLYLGDEKMPVCARCAGIIVGNFAGEAVFLLREQANPFENITLENSLVYCLVLSLFTMPLIIDGACQYFSDYESNNMLRVTTGILFGISLTAITDEIIRVLDYYL